MTAGVLSNNLPVLATKFDATNTNSTAPTLSKMNNGFIPNTDIITAEDHNYLHGTSTALVWLMQQLGLFVPFNPVAGVSVVATPKGGVVSIVNDSTGATEFYVAKVDMAIGYSDPSLDPTNWGIFDFNVLSTLSMATFYADAGGSIDARTGTYTVPYPVLLDGMQLVLDVPTANATTTPTFQPTLNGSVQTARTIVKILHGVATALLAGDLFGKCQLIYDLPNTQWILQNPAYTDTAINQSGGTVNATTGTFSGAIAANGGVTQPGSGGETIKILRGSIDDAGLINAGSGFSVSRTSTGLYAITFSTAFSAQPTVVATINSTGGAGTAVSTDVAATTTAASIRTKNSSNSLVNNYFDFIIIGPV